MQKKTLFLVGMRRSGTTTLFRVLRQDARFTAYDEPFNPLLRDIAWKNEWGTWDEFAAVFRRDPARYWEVFGPVQGIEELRDGLDERQRGWLAYLMDRAATEAVFADFTRCHFKAADLHALAPDGVLVHLYRSPEAAVTSNLLPSVWKKGRRLKYLRTRRKFWRIDKKYDFWGYETLIGRSADSYFGHRLREHGLDPEAVFQLPAVGRMLAFWKLAFDRLERDGRALFGERFVSLSFEDFCRAPQEALAGLYERLDMIPADLDLSLVREPGTVAFEGDPRWADLAARVGLDLKREA